MSMHQRYLVARGTSDLRITSRRATSADILVAAGLVARRNEKNKMAVELAGVIGTGEMRGAKAIALRLSQQLRRRSFKTTGLAMNSVEAFDTALMVLKWWLRPACLACGGHGHPTIENSPVIDDQKVCLVCEGAGKIPLERLLKPKTLPHAKWLAGEIEAMCSDVFSKIARRLHG